MQCTTTLWNAAADWGPTSDRPRYHAHSPTRAGLRRCRWPRSTNYGRLWLAVVSRTCRLPRHVGCLAATAIHQYSHYAAAVAHTFRTDHWPWPTTKIVNPQWATVMKHTHARDEGQRSVEWKTVLCEYVISAQFAYCRIFQQSAHIAYFFPHKLAFSTAISIFVMFLLPISTTFRYLEQIFVNRMAPSMCSVRTPVEQDEVVDFMQFCTIFPPHIWCLCGPALMF